MRVDARPGADYIRSMRAVMLEVPEELLEERRRKGHDRWDEVWEGVLHMVPSPSAEHQRLAGKLARVLGPLAEARGLEYLFETSLYRPGQGKQDYRTPDGLVTSPGRCGRIEGPCELVVEVLSPDDESYEKLAFYSDLGVREAIYVHPGTYALELFQLVGGRLERSSPDSSGRVRSAVLGVSFEPACGPALRLVWSGGEATI